MDAIAQVLADYPAIFFACHVRHVPDRETGATLSAHQASVLDHLDEVEPTGLLTLARHMGVTASTMSLTVDRLVRGGYVTRERDQADARRVHLRLTTSGVRIKRQQKVLEPERVGALLRRLSAAERREALAGLALLARAARELTAAAAGSGRKGKTA